MHFTVRLFVIPRDPSDLNLFQKQRFDGMKVLSEKLRRLEPVYGDQQLVFQGVEYAEIPLIDDACRQLEMGHGLSFFPTYSDEEILQARWVPLLIKGEYIDSDKSWRAFNRTWPTLCSACGYPNLDAIPKPYLIENLRPTLKSRICHAHNGLIIVSAAFWKALEPELKPWVQVGPVAFVESPHTVTPHWLWLRPTEQIGPYADHRVIRCCPTCRRPTEIRGCFEEHRILRGLVIVQHPGQTTAPIALVGNWFGELRPNFPPHFSWDMVISGQLHARFTELNVKGFHPSDKIAHTKTDLAQLIEPL